jgi:hypothetical protein
VSTRGTTTIPSHAQLLLAHGHFVEHPPGSTHGTVAKTRKGVHQEENAGMLSSPRGGGVRPARLLIPADTVLWHVHPRANGSPSAPRRFDAPGEKCWYAAESATTAAAEHFIPSAIKGENGSVLPLESTEGMALSAVRVVKDMRVLRLTSERDLAAAGLDTAAIDDVHPYRVSQELMIGLRARLQVPGVAWQSTENPPDQAITLFGDAPLEALPGQGMNLDSVEGALWLGRVLAGLRVSVPAPTTDPPLVFINYRSVDEKPAAVALDEEFARRLGPDAVFRDNRSLIPGTKYAAQILDRVRTAKVLVVTIGKHWESASKNGERCLDDPGDWVRREVETAFAHGVRVIPVLVGLRPELSPDALPPTMVELAKLQLMHIPYGYIEHAKQSVVDVVDRIIATTPTLTTAEADRAAIGEPGGAG